MAQASVDFVKAIKIDCSSQTNDNDEIYLYFSKSKTGRLYFSTVYKQHVLALNISSSKSFIMNKSVWKQFKKCISLIDDYFESHE